MVEPKNRRESDISLEVLNALLRYDPETGFLFWKYRPAAFFNSTRYAYWWNTRYADKRALCVKRPDGYLSGGIFHRGILAHRVCWAIAKGEWASTDLDHINGDKSDNRLNNLRPATTAENSRNRVRSNRNRSGHTGVHWNPPNKKWRVRIQFQYKMLDFGCYAEIEDAVTAAINARSSLGFHPNHGKTQTERKSYHG